ELFSRNSDDEKEKSHTTAQADTQGAYEFGRLEPGRYTLIIIQPNGDRGLIHGVEVQEGKTTQAPILKFQRAANRTGLKIQGEVLLPDGKQASSATLNLRTTRTYMSTTSNNGKISLDLSGEEGDPIQLTVSLAG